MLIQFNFKNFKSFREEATLDLSATKITEHPDHVVALGQDKLLKVAAIYGANASGKSNVYDAFGFMQHYVAESFSFGGEGSSRQTEAVGEHMATPFLFDEQSQGAPSTFEVFFVDNTDETQRTYQYGFALQKDEVVEEWLYSKAKTARNRYQTIVYRQKGQPLQADGLPKSSLANLTVALEKETLVLSLGAKLKIAKLKKVRDWFLRNEAVNFGDPMENFFRSRVLPVNFTTDKTVQAGVVEYFASFDEAICDFEVEQVQQPDSSPDQAYKIQALHKTINSDAVTGIPLQNESSGTLKMFALYPCLKSVLRSGATLFVDELNARLHPLLVRNIILTFLSPQTNPHHAQLIFTTHDISQLSNELLRRDEIWLVDKDGYGVSELYSLADFKDERGGKVRRDEALAKNYLTGGYGGIPALKPLRMFVQGDADGEKD